MYFRSTAAELLSHNFIKQTKKSNQNLIELLNNYNNRNHVINNESNLINDTQMKQINTTLENINIDTNFNDVEWLF